MWKCEKYKLLVVKLRILKLLPVLKLVPLCLNHPDYSVEGLLEEKYFPITG